LLRAMTPEELETAQEIMERAAARIEARKNGKAAIETTATPVAEEKKPK
jgi:hypothetical protein